MFKKLPDEKTMGLLLEKNWFCNLIMFYNIMKMTSMIFQFIFIVSMLVLVLGHNITEWCRACAWGFLVFSALRYLSLHVIYKFIQDVEVDKEESCNVTEEIALFLIQRYTGQPLQDLINECTSYAMKAYSDNIIKIDESQYLYIKISEKYTIKDMSLYTPEKQFIWTDLTSINQFKPTKEGRENER